MAAAPRKKAAPKAAEPGPAPVVTSNTPVLDVNKQTLAAKATDRINFIAEALAADGAFFREAKSYEKLDLPIAVEYFASLRRLHTAAEDLKKYIYRVSDAWDKRVIPGKMEIYDTTSITVGGYRVTVSFDKASYTMQTDAKDEATAWLKKNNVTGEELKDLVIETVNASTLSAAAKALLKDKGVEFPEELFKLTVLPSTSVTKVAK
jgi:hypothetical protein